MFSLFQTFNFILFATAVLCVPSPTGFHSSILPNTYRPWDVLTPSNIPDTPNKYHGHLFFAADDQAEVFINGVSKGQTTSWKAFAAVTDLELKCGDVIAIRAKDVAYNFYGVIAALYFDAQLHVTGPDDWRAVKETSSSTTWMFPSYSACAWPKAVSLPNYGTWNAGKSPYFPYYTKAEYVWANNTLYGTINMRYRVCGECCLPPCSKTHGVALSVAGK